MDGPDLDWIAAVSARAFASVAAIGVQDEHLEFFGVTMDGELHHRWHHDGWSDWSLMLLPGGARAAHLSAAAHGMWVDLVVITLDGRLLHRWWGRDRGWSEWGDWGGGFSGPVTMASLTSDHVELWVRRGGALVHRWNLNAAWSDWAKFT